MHGSRVLHLVEGELCWCMPCGHHAFAPHWVCSTWVLE
jgi:hypothetical protein